MKPWLWMALLWMGLAAAWPTAHATEAERPLSLMLLPPIAGKGSPQLAISWKGEQAGQLDLSVVDADGQRRRLKTRALEPGMHLDGVELSERDARLVAVLRDAAGRELARAEHGAKTGTPTSSKPVESANAVGTRGAPLGSDAKVTRQPDGGTLDWKATFAGNDAPNGTVHAITVYDDGTGPALVLGGEFTTAGGQIVNRIARWNGIAWSALGTGMNNQVSALTVYGGELIAGGFFTIAGGTAANNIARWNGSSWSALGAGVDNQILVLSLYRGELIAGGRFNTAGGMLANRIARWNGSNWSALGSGMNGEVRALSAYGGELIAGGLFTSAGGTAVNRIARWNGSSWSALGSGMDNWVFALAVYGGELIAGGVFGTAGGTAAASIARWNGSSWSALGSGMNTSVNALSVVGGELIAGGSFTTAGGTAANCIARWNGSSWSALGSGMNLQVNALSVYGDDLIAGGAFTTVGATAASFIARWNGSSWSALGSGINGQVQALSVYGGDLIAGGSFTTAGGTAANRIARWNGSSWSALDSGMNGSVFALGVYGGELIAGGGFTTAGGTAASFIARWNGSSWSALGSGMSSPVGTLSVYGGELVAGGFFTSAGGTAANYIARWNGNSWSALGSGMNAQVNALSVYGGELIAGGVFGTAGGTSASRIAGWNGSSWSALGAGMNGQVSSLSVFGGELMAGGSFTTAGGTTANRIARWNGSNWSAFGTGIDDWVLALNAFGGELIAGGRFNTAGDIPTPFIAAYGVADLTVTEIASTHPTPSRAGEPVRIRARVTASTAPTVGHITITGSPGGSCSDLTLTPVNDTTSEAECTIRWSTAGTRTLTARYIGGADWMPSTSAAFAHTVGAATPDWRPSFLGTAPNTWVRTLAVYKGDLIAGGDFTTVAGITVNYIARWNGTGWSSLGTGMNGLVLRLTEYNGDLIAGGAFTTAGGVTVNRIARWNGSAWSALGSGMNDQVFGLTVFQDQLIAGGLFTTAGGVTVNRIARWNGSAWSGLGSGMNALVYVVGVYNGSLIAGGDFSSAGGTSASQIARWNGTSWFALGSGVGGAPVALAEYNGNLIVGGFTSFAGGSPVNRIAQWNGSTWSALGAGVTGSGSTIVNGLTVYNGELIASGEFTAAGGVPANRVARWNGTNWSSLGTGSSNGTDGQTIAVVPYEGALVMGGTFTTAFGRATPYIAIWGPATTTTTQVQSSSPNPSLLGQPAILTARVSGRVTPNTGSVTFTAAPGGSCTDASLTSLNDTESEASCSITFSSNGVSSITASYSGGAIPGDFGHLPSASSVYSHAVGGSAALPTVTTITSVSSGSNAGLGQNYTVNVSVSASVTPVGTISISDGYGARCGPVAVSSGVAACSMTSWQVGPKTLRAVFTPGAGFAASSDTEALLVTSPGNDWLYVSSYGDALVRRARKDGTAVSPVMSLANGRAIAYDPVERRMYVGGCNSGGQLIRANLDGSGLTTIQSETGCIYGVALDPYTRKVYWSNLSNGTIRRSNLDGSLTETIATPGGGPVGIALDLEAGKIYWGEYSARRYRRANLDGSSIEAVLTRSTPVNFLYLDPPQDRSFLTEGLFGTDFFGRSTMSFSSVTGLGLSVVAPTAIAMDHITNRLYVANEGGGRVGAVNADGSAPVTTLFSGLASPIGLALIPAPDSSTSVVSTISSDPARIGAPTLVTITVTGAATRPANGQITVSANTGQSCNDATPEAGSGTSVIYACSLVFNDVIGVVSLNATFNGSTTHTGSTATAVMSVQQADTEMRIDGFNPSGSQQVNTAYEVYASVTGGIGPSGTIAVSDGAGGTCTITLPATSCELTSTSPGTKTITASYAGDSFHMPSSGTRSYVIRSAGAALPGLQVGAVVLPATAAAPAVNVTTLVSFGQAFREVPVVIVQASDENAGPQGLRIRNVTATGFEVLQVEPPGCSGCDGSSGAKTVHWLAATPGRYRLEQDTLTPAWLGSALRGTGPGALLIVGQVSTTSTQYNASVTGFSAWPSAAWEPVSWPTAGGGLDFSAPPVVLSTIQSWANEGANLTAGGLVGASQPWAQSAQRNVTTGGFQLALDAGEVSADDLAPAGFATPEVVGYVAMDANVSQALLPVGGPPTVGLVSGAVSAGVLCRTLDLDFPLGTAIDAANFRGFAGKQSRAIPDGGWLRRCQLTNPASRTVRIGFRREEDQAFDHGDPALRSPIEDQAGTVAFSGDFTTTPVTLAEMSVSRVGGEIDVRWSTATEVAQLGFRLWGRPADGKWRLLTPELIGATAGERMTAASYSARVPAEDLAELRLEDVDVLGQARFHPALKVGESRGAAPTESSIDWGAIRTENAAVMSARAAAPTSATASVLARVSRDGVQRIAGSALIALDARFAGAPASSLAVLDGERPVWRHVACSTLSADCTVEFVGQARESRYGAVRAYTITLDPAAVRTAASGHVQAGSASLRSYASEVRDYSNRLYNASINGPDQWHDARIAATSGPAEVSRSFTLPERVAGPVTLTVDLHGGLDFPDAAPDHHVQLLLNGQQVADRWFDGLRPERIEVAVPESLLTTSNTLTIRVPRDTGYSADVVLLEGYSLRYTRQSRMDGASLAQGRLDPTLAGAVSGELLRDGFETVTPNPGFSGFALAGAPTGTVLWSEVDGKLGRDLLPAGEVRVDTRSSRWLAAAPAAVQSPTLALPATAYSLPAELDYLVIAHPLFADGLQPLLQLQASRGLDTAVITTEAIYAAHSQHVPDPAAIRTAVQAAKARGARFLLLVGGDSYDYHDYLGIGSQSYVPTEYVSANDYLFHAATDAAYADVDGDRQPDVALGRLPVRTQAELTRVLSSIVARGNTLPQQYLAVAGRSDPGENFALHGRASLSVLRQGQQKAFALADEIGTAAAREQARAGLAGSADWISYQGHSSPSRWAFDNLLDVGQLGNVQRSGLPAVVSQWSCWTNAFVLPTQDTMAHALMLRDNRLAASVIGATSLAEDASHLALAVRFFDLVEDGKLRESTQVTAGTIGEALQQAGRDLLSREPQHAAAVLNIALFGDPAAPIR